MPRKRGYSKLIPLHIEQAKLPTCVYWDASGNGRWRISYKDEDTGKQRMKTIAGPKATLADLVAYGKVIQFAQERGALPTTAKGSVPEYLWCVIELCYLCRLRGIEAITLTDANETPRGVQTNRRKGSRDNIVLWTPRLRAAWDAAKTIRQRRRDRLKLPTSTRPDERWLFLSNDNSHIRRDTLSQAVDRLMSEAIEAGVIEPEQRFTLHPVKRRGVTDTAGNRSDKQTASGHKDEKMLDIYDMELPEVQTSERL